MAIKRNVGKTSDAREGVPFADSEEAWVWYSQCQRARDEGARVRADLGGVPRPCLPDDIAREVRRLYRLRVLRGAHLRILARLVGEGGGAMSGGAMGGGESEERLWREALDRLTTPLRAKGIVT